MFCTVSRFSVTIDDGVRSASDVLSRLADHRVDLLGTAVTQPGTNGAGAADAPFLLTLFTTDAALLQKTARIEKLDLDGPYPAILVQDADRHGALAAVMAALTASGVTISCVQAMRDGRGRFGCLVVLPPEEVDRALRGLARAA